MPKAPILLFSRPTDPALLGQWLETILIEGKSRQLATEIEAFGLADPNSTESNQKNLTESLPTILENGLSSVNVKVFQSLLKTPRLLPFVEEEILLNGGQYWESRLVEDLVQSHDSATITSSTSTSPTNISSSFPEDNLYQLETVSASSVLSQDPISSPEIGTAKEIDKAEKPARSLSRSLVTGFSGIVAAIVLIACYVSFVYIPQSIFAEDSKTYRLISNSLSQYLDVISEDVADDDLLEKIDRQIDQYQPKLPEFQKRRSDLIVRRHCVRCITLAKNGDISEARQIHKFATDQMEPDADHFTKFYLMFSAGVIEFHNSRTGRHPDAFAEANKIFSQLEKKIEENSNHFSSQPMVIARFFGLYAMSLVKRGKVERSEQNFQRAFTWLDKASAETKAGPAWIRAWCRFRADKTLIFNRQNAYDTSISWLKETLQKIDDRPDLDFYRGLILNNMGDSMLNNRIHLDKPAIEEEVSVRQKAIFYLQSAYRQKQTTNISQNYHLGLVRLAGLYVHIGEVEKSLDLFDNTILRDFPVNPFHENQQTGTCEDIIIMLVGANSKRFDKQKREGILKSSLQTTLTGEFYVDETFAPACTRLLNHSYCPDIPEKKKFLTILQQKKFQGFYFPK